MDKDFDNLTPDTTGNHRGTAGENEAQTRGLRVTWPAGCGRLGLQRPDLLRVAAEELEVGDDLACVVYGHRDGALQPESGRRASR